MIYAVTRRYLVEDVVYVEADSPSQAKERARAGDYLDQTHAETVGPTTHRRAELRPAARYENWELRLS